MTHSKIVLNDSNVAHAKAQPIFMALSTYHCLLNLHPRVLTSCHTRMVPKASLAEMVILALSSVTSPLVEFPAYFLVFVLFFYSDNIYSVHI